MRRWFIVFLSLVMTAQLSWAAMAMCCAHELGAGRAQQDVQVLAAAEPSVQDSASHLAKICDTGHCHCHHAGVAVGTEAHLALVVAQRVVPSNDSCDLGKSHIPAGLDRPNWQRA